MDKGPFKAFPKKPSPVPVMKANMSRGEDEDEDDLMMDVILTGVVYTPPDHP